MKEWFPAWAHDWLDVIVPTTQVLLILVGAWLLRTLVRQLIQRLGQRYALPREVVIMTRRLSGFLIYLAAVLAALGRFGVSGSVLWTAFTGFAAVAAVAFFAAWSVLSNIFCTLLIFTTRMFWPGDTIEVLENGEKPGFKGRVLDINLVFTTLEETGSSAAGTTLRVPNSLFFQRALRRWHGPAPTLPATVGMAPAPVPAAPVATPPAGTSTAP